MDNETQERIVRETYIYQLLCRLLSETEGMIPAGRAERIMKLYKAEGYRKLPRDKPRIVAWAMEDVSKDAANALIQVQGEADIKHYEGE